jgi:NAD(P)H-nitrite reductase large subunit
MAKRKQTHYAIIGSGAAGNEAAWQLRQRDPDSRITIVTAGKLLFISRYVLPRVLRGESDWSKLLVHSPDYYDEQRIELRRNTRAVSVDAQRRVIRFRHKEEMAYDKLLVASGGGGYLPEWLREYRHLMQKFTTFGDAVRLRRMLPKKGRVLIIDGDMQGIDLGRALAAMGHRVSVVVGDRIFWPHDVEDEDLPRFLKALEKMGMEVINGRQVTAIGFAGGGARGSIQRRVSFDAGRDIKADAVLPFCGLSPGIDYMVGAGVDIERGLLVNPELKTTDPNIWAAGDVCQIWSPEENRYRFYYGWKNVKLMGRIAAFNMTGGNEVIETFKDEKLTVTPAGEISSPYWEYD